MKKTIIFLSIVLISAFSQVSAANNYFVSESNSQIYINNKLLETEILNKDSQDYVKLWDVFKSLDVDVEYDISSNTYFISDDNNDIDLKYHMFTQYLNDLKYDIALKNQDIEDYFTLQNSVYIMLENSLNEFKYNELMQLKENVLNSNDTEHTIKIINSLIKRLEVDVALNVNTTFGEWYE